MTEVCAACEQRYLYELEYRCVECDAPLCPICAVSVRARRTVRCVDCHDAAASDRRPE
ncbi:MAG: hypothetical protein ACRELV_04305 [Longimicrobiales bacterium]